MPDHSNWSLNPAQYDAVKTLAGPLLVLAGSGTGKTRVVTYRIAELIRHRIRPDRILAVTFTNKAAEEMQAAQPQAVGQKARKRRPEISTFHSLCAAHPAPPHPAAWLSVRISPFTIAAIRKASRGPCLREIRAPDAMLRPGDLIYLIGRWKSASVRPGRKPPRMAQTDREHLAAAAYRRYQNALKAAGGARFRRHAALHRRSFRRASPRRERPRPAVSIICWSTSIKTPTAASIGSSRPWPPAMHDRARSYRF